ncbi:MAG: hypothetical protein ACK4Q5_13700 [Saprospiraceae bacterium]
MTEHEILDRLKDLDFKEKKHKLILRWLVTYPQYVPGGKKGLDEQVNFHLDELVKIWQDKEFWLTKLKEA